MADIEDDDDEFGSDDAFEDLPPNTLLQLEQQASQYVQQLPRQFGALSTSATRYAANANQRQESWRSERTVQPVEEQQDYGYDDEDVIDLDQDPYALPQQYNQGPTFAGRIGQDVPPEGSYVHVQAPAANAGVNASVAELQARILQVRTHYTLHPLC